jgi:hypothetical protein
LPLQLTILVQAVAVAEIKVASMAVVAGNLVMGVSPAVVAVKVLLERPAL